MVHLEHVSKTYGKNGKTNVRALNDISLDIGKGSFTSIVGTSGSGKSTLMNIMGLLDRPSAGAYQLDGINVEELKEDELAGIRNKKIGFVFQAFHLLPRTTARENVELPLIYSNGSGTSKRAEDVLKAVGLEHRMNHTPGEMSGGEKQRVAIARALINDPEIILADEPTGNLDPESSIGIMTLFRDLHQEGRTIIIITHEMDIAEHTRRIIRISGGEITEDRRN